MSTTKTPAASTVKQTLEKNKVAIESAFWELLTLIGIMVLLRGLGLMYEPLAWIIGGAVIARIGYYRYERLKK